MTWEIKTGDCLETLRAMESNSIHAIVTDPPAGIGFMGKDWDKDKGGRDKWIAWMTEVASECRRVLKPGGHALVWALPRTSHWTATAWEDAGFEVRDRIAHVFGTGFPKSLDVSKAIDKAAGAERPRGPMKRGGERLARLHAGSRDGGGTWGNEVNRDPYTSLPATDDAKRWQGYGTALKPAVEDWWVFRRPLIGTVAANVLEHGTGGLNVDGCRVGTSKRVPGSPKVAPASSHTVSMPGYDGGSGHDANVGRFPPHLLLTHSPDCGEECAERCPVAGMDEPAKFFPAFKYQAKPSTREKSAGLEHREVMSGGEATGRKDGSAGTRSPRAGAGRTGGARNPHPTVKPIELMRWLCRLVTPPGGVVLDPFSGSGTTGCAAVLEGFGFIGCEQSEEFAEVARDRIKHWSGER